MTTETTTETRVVIQAKLGGAQWKDTGLGCAPDQKLTVERAMAWLRPHPMRDRFRVAEIAVTTTIHHFD